MSGGDRWWERHLWQIPAFQDVGLLAALAALLWLFVTFQAVTIPAAAALVLAQVFSPVVRYTSQRWGWSRAASASVCLGALVVVVLTTLVYGVPQLAAAVQQFTADVPSYAEQLGVSIPEPDGLTERLLSLGSEQLFGGAQKLVGLFGAALGVGGYLLVAGVFVVWLTGYLLVRLDQLPDVRVYLPASQRERLWSMMVKFEKIFGGFIRGQLVVAVFTMAVFGAGFALSGVPHPLVPALIGGVLSIIPNGQASGWLLALLLVAAGHAEGTVPDPLWQGLLWPTVVYIISQNLETFVVVPMVQGSYTRLHPLAVLGALIGGTVVGGLAGLFLAVPVAACARVLLEELVAPTIEDLAAER